MPEFDFSPITEGIYNVIETEEKVLTSLPEETITQKRNRQNRTIKQILGHLIDSASNNHQRMIRLQSVRICFSFLIIDRIMICG